MPANRSNKELLDEIVVVDPSAKVDGLNNAQLSDLLDSLKAKPPVSDEETKRLADADKKAKDQAAAQVEANRLQELADAAEKNGSAKHVVAYGMSVTSKRGIIDAGQPVISADFHATSDFRELLARGVIVPNS